jgi:hypothetical protein
MMMMPMMMRLLPLLLMMMMLLRGRGDTFRNSNVGQNTKTSRYIKTAQTKHCNKHDNAKTANSQNI